MVPSSQRMKLRVTAAATTTTILSHTVNAATSSHLAAGPSRAKTIMNSNAAMATLVKIIKENVIRVLSRPVSEVLTLVVVALLLWGCDPSQATRGQYVHLPADGWDRSMPVTFEPEYGDSAGAYDIELALRHTMDYGYRNLSLVVDLIGDSARVERYRVNFTLADRYGNWLGTGFGALYQNRVTVARGVSPRCARRLVVWQAMDNCPVLTQVQELGVIVSVTE